MKSVKTSYIAFYIRGPFFVYPLKKIQTCQNINTWSVINDNSYVRVLQKSFTDIRLYSTKIITYTRQYSKKLILVLVAYSTDNFRIVRSTYENISIFHSPVKDVLAKNLLVKVFKHKVVVYTYFEVNEKPALIRNQFTWTYKTKVDH